MKQTQMRSQRKRIKKNGKQVKIIPCLTLTLTSINCFSLFFSDNLNIPEESQKKDMPLVSNKTDSQSVRKKKKKVSFEESTDQTSAEEPKQIEAEEPKVEEFHFTVLGGDTSSIQPRKSARKADWIANAETVTSHLDIGKVPIEILTGLHEKIIECLVQQEISHFFPIQKLVIPQLVDEVNRPSIPVQPRDFCVSAPTGSGKTLCYVIPILQYLLKCRMATVTRQIRALVMVPVQELATQVYNVFVSFTQGTHLQVARHQ